jgi:hypothetical protein
MDTKPSDYDAQRCLQTIGAIEADLGRLTANLTEAQFQAPPRTGGWSIAYCIEHLTLAGNSFLREWEAALGRAAVTGGHGDGAFAYSWLQRRILDFAEPPYGVKIKAPKPLEPCSRRSMEETVRRFLQMHREFARRVSASRGSDAQRIKVRSPFLSWIRYPLGMSFDLALAHERRHLWQALQVRSELGLKEE